jgi:cytosine/uracil/thiamine/allantoin permease
MKLGKSEKHYKGLEEGDEEKQEFNGEERWKRKKRIFIFLLVPFFLFHFFSTSISSHLSSHCKTCLHAANILESRRGTLPAVLINMLCFLLTAISNGVVRNY